ncbi:hypothetical protein [Oceaniglobus roseus]|nr:hypothetical protein [Kandeliimicrobium roseum]
MTNRIALGLALLICAFVAFDLYTGGGRLLFLARRFADLVQHVAFWR